jgi:hypothetical protein
MGLVRLDKIGANNHIYNIKLGADAVNGNVVGLGSYAEYDVYNGTTISALTELPIFLAEEFLNYTGYEAEEDMVLKSGKIVRGYQLQRGDVVTATDDVITGTIGAGDLIEASTALKLLKVATPTTGARLSFRVIEKDSLNGATASVLEVL